MLSSITLRKAMICAISFICIVPLISCEQSKDDVPLKQESTVVETPATSEKKEIKTAAVVDKQDKPMVPSQRYDGNVPF